MWQMLIAPITSIVNNLVGGVTDHFASKRKLKQAVTENKIRMAESTLSHNQDWEMKQLDNSGWKDDVLFYAIVFFFVYTGINPEHAGEIIKNWEILPDWFITIFGWVVAAVLGVKKIGDYLPMAIRGVKTAINGKGE